MSDGASAGDLAPALIKGLSPYAGPGSALSWDRFGTMELGQVLDPRGPHVGSSGSPTYFALRPLDVFPKHLERMGVPAEAIKRIIKSESEPEKKEDLKIGALLRVLSRVVRDIGVDGYLRSRPDQSFLQRGNLRSVVRSGDGDSDRLDRPP